MHDQDPSLTAVRVGERMPIPADCPPQIKQLILACWRLRRAERASIADVLQLLHDMAPAMHADHTLLALTMHLEQALHARRAEAHHDVHCQVTLQPIEGSVEKYRERHDNHAGPAATHNAPHQLQQVFDDFLASSIAGTLLLLGEGGLGKSLSMCMLADRTQQHWWQHFADPASQPKPRYLPVFIRSHVDSWTHATLENACADALQRHDLQPGQATPLVFVEHMVNNGKGMAEDAVLRQLQASHATLTAGFATFAQQTALLAAKALDITLSVTDDQQPGSPWARLGGLVGRQAQQRYQERQARLAILGKAEQKEQSRRMVLSEEDFIRLQLQKATRFTASLPLRAHGGVLEFIHESVFEHCLAQRLLYLLDQESVGMTQEAMEKMLSWTKTSSPEALIMLYAEIEAREAAGRASSALAAENQHKKEAQLFVWVAKVLEDRQLHASAVKYRRKALEIRETVLGTDHADTASSYKNVGKTFKVLGQNKEALAHYQKALEVAIAIGDAKAQACYQRNIASPGKSSASQKQGNKDSDKCLVS